MTTVVAVGRTVAAVILAKTAKASASSSQGVGTLVSISSSAVSTALGDAAGAPRCTCGP